MTKVPAWVAEMPGKIEKMGFKPFRSKQESAPRPAKENLTRDRLRAKVQQRAEEAPAKNEQQRTKSIVEHTIEKEARMGYASGGQPRPRRKPRFSSTSQKERRISSS